MGIPFETAVIEDLATGYGTKSVTMPAGGSATGNKINRGTIPAPTSRVGIVNVYPPQTYLGVGVVYAPDGTEVSTAGTTTSGLQEAINYAVTHGFDLHVHGGGDQNYSHNGGAALYRINDGVTLDIPAVQGKHMYWGAVTLAFQGTDTTPCLRFDSFMMLHFIMCGSQIVTARVGSGVLVNPRAVVPIDGIIVCIDSTIQLTTIAMGGATGVCWQFQSNTGDIASNVFHANELNGGTIAIQVDKPTSTKAFAHNLISCPHVHGQQGLSPQVLIGDSAGAANVQIQNNVWDLRIIHDSGGGDGYYTREVRGSGRIGGASLSTSYFDMRFEDQADKNDFILSTDKGATDYGSVTRDASTSQNNRVSVMAPAARKVCTPAASPAKFPAASDTDIAAREFTFTVQGGTVTKIEQGDGTTWDDVGETAGQFFHRPGRWHRITYSSVPNVVALL